MKHCLVYYVYCFSFFTACLTLEDAFGFPSDNTFNWIESPNRALGLHDDDHEDLPWMPNRQMRRLNHLDPVTHLPLRSPEAHLASPINPFSFFQPEDWANIAFSDFQTEFQPSFYAADHVPDQFTGIHQFPTAANSISSDGTHSHVFPSLPTLSPLPNLETYGSHRTEKANKPLEPSKFWELYSGNNHVTESHQPTQHQLTNSFPESWNARNQDEATTQTDTGATISKSKYVDPHLVAFAKNVHQEPVNYDHHELHSSESLDPLKLRFTREILQDRRPSATDDAQADQVLEVLKKVNGVELILSEDKLKSVMGQFHGPRIFKAKNRKNGLVPRRRIISHDIESILENGPTSKTNRVSRNNRCPDREEKVNNRRLEFLADVNTWYDYWQSQYNINFKNHLRAIQHHVLKENFPLFIFYVDMIRTIVPRPNEQPKLGDREELELATASYLNLANFVVKEEPIEKAMMIADNLNSSFHKAHSYHTLLWNFLEFWMEEYRPTLLNIEQGRHDRIHSLAKTFFNNIFCMSHANLSDRYKTIKAQKTLPH
ncbi:hypothetical protein PGT21_033267 [Puccinia graminis f. sp. tritici]|uniref:Uncharacterized protein n=1 Tax=Puccinia graminis f. sp. tritici TaxID=56615 RepID=A0A5B0QCC2_PUCGR|nr:hypothetical protein PGT21_033267 [Puccinia graminis f. sp. tritici]